ncbi:MAG: hypothetical protein ACI9W4_001290 [Rhodothermales bacterium]|jgi:hypothetical protein
MSRRTLLTLAALVLLAILQVWSRDKVSPDTAGSHIESAFQARASNVWVTGEGVVARTLPDDNEGSRHQRFIVALPSGQTVLVSHNIDLAPRVDALQQGDAVSFHGEYEYNEQGGVVHWTHHDPQGRRAGGWIEHNGERYR